MAEAKVLSQQMVYEGRVVKLRLDKVIEPAGHEAMREIVVHPGAVCIVARPRADEVLLIRQYRHAAGKILLEIPAGGLNKDEAPDKAAIRELEEETGYRAGKMVERARFWTTPGFTTEFMYLYEASELVKTKTNPDEDEVIELDIVHRDEALRMIDDGRIEDAKTILGLLRVFGVVMIPQWRKNQIAVTASAAFIFFGYTLVIPFLPIYVRELGIETTAGIAFWSGLLISASPLVASVAGPLWGRLGDRRGMKLMAQRSTIFNAVLWFSMGFAQNVYQLLAIRALLGLMGGFNSVSVAMITQNSPQHRVPQLIGTMQSVSILAAAIGPFFGGIVANMVGVRATFFVTGIVMLGSVISVFALYRDGGRVLEVQNSPVPAPSPFWRQREYFTVMMILFFVNMADRTLAPILPLYLEELGTPAARLVAVSGAVVSIAAFAEALSAWASGKLAAHISLRRLLIGRLLFSILVLMPMMFVTSAMQFSVLRVILALLAGGTLTLALGAASHVIPREHRGTGFALLSSTSMLGGAAGPLLAGVIAGFSFRSVFLFNALVYLFMVGFVYRQREAS